MHAPSTSSRRDAPTGNVDHPTADATAPAAAPTAATAKRYVGRADVAAQTDAAATAAMPLSLAPALALPAPSSSTDHAASPAQVRLALERLCHVSDLYAFALIQAGQMKTMALAGALRTQAQAQLAKHSLDAVRHMLEQIVAERRAAWTKLAGSSAGTAVSFGAGVHARQLRQSDDGANQAKGAGLDGASQQLGNVVSGVVDAVDKTLAWRYGGTANADLARVQQREDDLLRNLAQRQVDGSRGAYDQAERAFQNALQAFSDYTKRKEALSNATAAR